MLPVNRPAISNFDPDANQIYSPRSGDSATLSRDFNISALTGELLHFSAPGKLQNASYNLEIVVPIVRCFPSNSTIRAWTAASAFQDLLEGQTVLENATFYPESLTFVSKEASEFQYIGYHGLYGNTSITPHQPGFPADLWITIINAPIGTTIDDLDNFINPTQFSASFYTCSLRNASIDVDFTFVDNVQSLHIAAIHELEFDQSDTRDVKGNDSSPIYAFENYSSFISLLYGQLLGTVSIGGNNESFGWTWHTNIDRTIFGTAADFSAMMDAWKDGGIERGAVVQDKNLTTLIEEFSVNASLNLGSRSTFRFVLSRLLCHD